MSFTSRPIHVRFASPRAPALLILLTIVAIGVGQCSTVSSLHNGLSRVADQWTEADTLRAAEGYATTGFAANAGLPDLCFGEQFADHGTKKLLRDDLDKYGPWERGALSQRTDSVDSNHFVYTHYPPGPHWLAGIMTVAIGVGHADLYRILPVVLGLLAIAYLAYEMWASLGGWSAAILLLIFTALPMFTNMMHGLSYQGYAFALLLIELALCLRVCREGLRHGPLAALGVLGFVQGWLGFDYLFLVVLAPFSVWLACSKLKSIKPVVLSGAASALGFGAANFLHVGQVIAYYGNVRVALDDLMTVAHYRASSDVLDGGRSAASTIAVLWDYLANFTAMPLFFNISILVLCACGICILVLIGTAFGKTMLLRRCIAIGTSVAIASCWVLLMPQHAAQHWHFIPRHYFLPVFVTLLAIAVEFRVRSVGGNEFRILWFAAWPVLMLAALVLRHSDMAPLTDLLLPLATPEITIAYSFVGAIAFYCWRYRGIAWAKWLIFGPMAWMVLIAAVMSIADLLWYSQSYPLQFPSVRLDAVVLPALLVGYATAGLGWIISKKFEDREKCDSAVAAS